MISAGGLTALHKRVDALRARNLSYLDQYAGAYPTVERFIEAASGFALDPWQRLYTASALVSPLAAICASRQSGKSTVTAGFVAFCLVFVRGFRCLVASRSLRQASYFVDKVRLLVLSVIPREAMVQLNRLSMTLPNQSFVISIPCAQPDAGRGFDPHLVVIDEAAFAPQALFDAVLPSVAATQGAVHMISSPNGRNGYFFDAFEGAAKGDFWSTRVTWEDCPRNTPEQMERFKRTMGVTMWRQEFCAEFIVPEGAFFGASALELFEDGEEMDLSDLSLDDMELLVNSKFPAPSPNKDDLRMAFDRADRVRQLLMAE